MQGIRTKALLRVTTLFYYLLAKITFVTVKVMRFNGRSHRTFRAKLGDSFTRSALTALHRAAAL